MTHFINSNFMQKRGGEELGGERARSILQSCPRCMSHWRLWKGSTQDAFLEPCNTGAEVMLSGCHRRVLSQSGWSDSKVCQMTHFGDRVRMLWLLSSTSRNSNTILVDVNCAYNYWKSLGLLSAEMAFLVGSLHRLKIISLPWLISRTPIIRY